MTEGTIAFQYAFPSEWPPKADSEMTSYTASPGGYTVKIGIKTTGGFWVSYSDASENRTALFQPLIIISNLTVGADGLLESFGSYVLLVICFGGESFEMYCNGKPLLLADVADGQAMIVDTRSGETRKLLRLIYDSSLSITRSRDNKAECLFLDTILELDSLRMVEGERESLRMSLLLRQLLWDGGGSLALRLLKKYHVKLLFPFVFNKQQAYYKLADFSKCQAFVTDRIAVSVKDVVLTYAHVKGGVHLGEAKTLEEKLVESGDESMLLDGKPVGVFIMSKIANSVLLGLKPLVDAVIQKNT